MNYLVRLGWSHGDQEIFSIDEMAELFDIHEVNHAASAFNPEKLLWLNHHYIKTSPVEYIARQLMPRLGRLGIDPSEGGPDILEVVEALRERARTLIEMADMSQYFYRDFEEFDETAAKKHLRPVCEDPLMLAREHLAALDEWTVEALHAVVTVVSEELDLNMGKVAQPLRVAISGRSATPGIDVTLYLVGREQTLARIDRALDYISDRKA